MSEAAPPPEAQTSTQQQLPLRIQRIALTDFRAFPGPAPVVFDLNGKNLLVYGENGSGKSSLFHALREFFSLQPMPNLLTHKNVFSDAPADQCRVVVDFVGQDGHPAEWTSKRHPCTQDFKQPVKNASDYFFRGADSRVLHVALRSACLDYKSLLDTNYKHGAGDINLFEVAVTTLLCDCRVTVAGGTVSRLGDLWARVLAATADAKSPKPSRSALGKVNQSCVEFNSAFRLAIERLLPEGNRILAALGWQDVVLTALRTPGVVYKNARLRRDRIVEGQSLIPELTYRGHPLERPQMFLNEARLSGLGLALYLGGRLACTPSGETTSLKLLVLDDVLIGLDHSNRLPVLDVLRTHFADWQTVLLTHDHVWFEMARFHLGVTNQWKCMEVYEGADVERGIPAPTVRPVGSKTAKACLEQARSFLKDHYIPAAANYTRAAFELALKSFCERFGVPVAFMTDPSHLDTNKLLSAVEAWLKSHGAKGCMSGVIERVKLFRKVVLNPYSHAAPPNIARAEVEGAIAAIEALLVVVEVGGIEGDPLQAAQALIAKMPASTMELHAALGFLRAAFVNSLRKFCDRKHVRIAYKVQAIEESAAWQAIYADQANLFPTPHDGLPAQINAECHWLISPVTETNLLALSYKDLVRIVEVVSPAGAQQTVLDGI